MTRFCPHDWHQTTETDLQHIALGGGDYEYAVWESEAILLSSRYRDFEARQREQKVITDKAHALAEQRGIIPYTAETFEQLMQEVERNQ